MDNKAMVLGLGGILVGLAAGVVVGNSASTEKVQRAINRTLVPAQQAQDATTAGTQEALAALDARLATLETAVSEARVDPQALADSVSAQTSGLVDGLATRLDEMQGALGSQIADGAKAQTEAVQASMAELAAGLSDSARIAAAAVVSADAGESLAQTSAGGTELSAVLGVGQTAVFADGALRAFVSRMDTEAGSARLAINGETVSLGMGGTTPVTVNAQACSVSVMAVTDEGVTLGSDCGALAEDAQASDDPAAAEGGDAAEGSDAGEAVSDDPAAGATEDAAASEPAEQSAQAAAPAQDTSDEAMANSAGAGNTVRFADGALRAFVVAVDEAGNSARVAINGVNQMRLSVGESVEVPAGEQTCTLTLAGVRDGKAGFAGDCQ